MAPAAQKGKQPQQAPPATPAPLAKPASRAPSVTMSPASASGSECSYGVHGPPAAHVPLQPIRSSLKVAYGGFAQLAAQVLGFAGTEGAAEAALAEWGAEVDKAVKAAGLGAVPGMSVLGGWLLDELPGWCSSEPGLADLRRASDAIIMLFRHTFPALWESVTQLKGGRRSRPGRGGCRSPASAAPPPRAGRGGLR